MRLQITSASGDDAVVRALELVDDSLRQVYAGFDPDDVVPEVARSLAEVGVDAKPEQVRGYAEAIARRSDFRITVR